MQQVRLLIREALFVFGADKTGLVDYALESAGKSSLTTYFASQVIIFDDIFNTDYVHY